MRVELWHRALAATRTVLQDAGLREVSTPVRLDAVALEPFIEPVGAQGKVLATSPELPMKRLLARGSGPIFQIAPVFRRGEEGALHSEEFRLIEWYRVQGHAAADQAAVRSDVQALVQAVCEVAESLGLPSQAPSRWEVRGLLDVVEETTGIVLRGDEGPEALARVVGRARPDLWVEPPGGSALRGTDAGALAAWTSLFTTFCDACLDPWLSQRQGVGTHLVDFPVALAALSRRGAALRPSPERANALARRFESHVGGVELANGYEELTDPGEQRRRFEAVAALRRSLGQPALPWPETFLSELADPGLPPCSGAALGLDRLLMVATGAETLGDITP